MNVLSILIVMLKVSSQQNSQKNAKKVQKLDKNYLHLKFSLLTKYLLLKNELLLRITSTFLKILCK